MKRSIHVVNVFTNEGIYGGNQLGIMPDALSLSNKKMQLIAKQMNYSESSFVTNHDNDSAEVRIFLPSKEIPFAGHPSLGTAYLIEKLHRIDHNPRNQLKLKLQGGDVMTYFEKSHGMELGRVYMDQLPVSRYGTFGKSKELISALGLTSDQLITDEFPIIAPSDLKFVFIPVKTPNYLKTLKPDLQKIIDVLDDPSMDPYLFSPTGLHGGDVYARFFAPNSGIVEDPATGSAQAALIHAMDSLALLPDKEEIITEQGYDQGRPSKLFNKIIDRDTFQIQTGGYVSHIIDGTIFL